MDQTPTSQPEFHQTFQVPKPKHTLQSKAIILAVVLVTVSTGLCGYLMATFAGWAMHNSLERDAQIITDTVSKAITQQFNTGQKKQIGNILNQLVLDEQIAFITITDPHGNIQARRITNQDAWNRTIIQQIESQSNIVSQVNQTIHIGDYPQVILIHTQPIWATPEVDISANRRSDSLAHSPNKMLGYVEIALHDPQANLVMNNLRMATVAVVCLICLICFPLVFVISHRLTNPLRRLLQGISQLSEGMTPEPLPYNDEDEIGLLTKAFNTMAGNLYETHFELERINLQLEDKVNQRTSELQRANRRLMQEMQDKDDFVRTISHDLNAPLRNIAGMTKMLIKKYSHHLADDAILKLERIAANAHAETELLSDLLELTRIKSQPGKRQTVDTNKVIEMIAQSLEYDLQQKDIQLTVVSDLPQLQLDRNRIRQVFQNLIDNAVKYMPDTVTDKRIKVGYGNDDHPNAFYVRDNGKGIVEKDQRRIFQMFQRARYSGQCDIAGRGVGLASVKTIIETYGGQIWVDSQPDQGATFYFTIDQAYFNHKTTATKKQKLKLKNELIDQLNGT